MVAHDTAHFKVTEFRCKHCGIGDDIVKQELIDAAERLRLWWGRPLVVVSGVRCLVHNAAVGGAKGSAHPLGMALDVEDPHNELDIAITDEVLAKLGLWREHPGNTPGWFHGQVRPVPGLPSGVRTFRK